MNTTRQSGEVNPLLITSVLLGFLTIALAGVSVWAFMNYQDQKNNTDQKIAAAVEVAEDEQAAELEEQFLEREKSPVKRFSGPADLGSVSFEYPKTWSVHTATSDDELNVYLHPNVVPPIDRDRPYALRIAVEDENYERVIGNYERLVEQGGLKSDSITINDFVGVKLEGKFSEQRQGSMVVFKIRDKTLSLATDSTSYVKDFNDIILPSLRFNP